MIMKKYKIKINYEEEFEFDSDDDLEVVGNFIIGIEETPQETLATFLSNITTAEEIIEKTCGNCSRSHTNECCWY